MGGKSEETIVYWVSEAGAAKTADGFDKVSVALLKTIKLQDALTSAQKQSGDISRIAAYRAEAERVNVSTSATAAAMKKLAEAANDNGKAFAGMGRQVQEAGTMLGHAFASLTGLTQFQGAISGVSQKVTEFAAGLVGGNSLRQAGAVALGAATGAGALATGGVVGALGLLGYTFLATSKHGDALTLSVLKNTEALGPFIARLNALKNYAGRQDGGANTNFGDAAAATALLDADRKKLAGLEHALRDPNVIGNAAIVAYDAQRPALDAEIKLLESQLARIDAAKSRGLRNNTFGDSKAEKDRADQRFNAELNAQDKKDQEAALATYGAAGLKKRTFDMTSPEERAKKAKKQMSESDEKTLAFLGEGGHEGDALEGLNDTNAKEGAAREVFNMQEESKHRNAVFQHEQEEKRHLAEVTTNFFKAQNDKRLAADRSATDQRIALETKFGDVVLNVMEQTVMAAIHGQKIELDKVLESIGTQMLFEGAKAILAGTIRGYSSYGMDATAQLLISTGITEMGIGAGLTGAGVGIGGLMGGGGGGGSPHMDNPSASGSSPYRDNNALGSSGTVNNITYVEFTSPFAPSAQDGMRIRQSLNAANQTYGPQR